MDRGPQRSSRATPQSHFDDPQEPHGEQALLTPPRLVQPRWLTLVCWHRNEFEHTALALGFAGAVRYFKFLWVKQNPQLACFCSMRPDDGPIFEAHVKTEEGQGVGEALRHYALHFEIDFNISLMASDLGWVDSATADVLQDVVSLGSELMGADGPVVPLEECVGSDAAATAADYDAETKPRTTALVSSANFEGSDSLPEEAASNVLAKHLWVAELLGGETKAASAHEANLNHGVSQLSSDSSADEGAADKQSERAVETVLKNLFKVRQSWVMETTEHVCYSGFSVHILGGAWTKAHDPKAANTTTMWARRAPRKPSSFATCMVLA